MGDSSYWYIITGMATSFLLCIAILLFYLKYKKNIMQHQYQLKVAEVEYQKKLLNSVIVTQEEERKRIAVALHDDVGNLLNIISLLINNNKTGTDISNTQIKNHLQKVTETVRTVSHSLYPVNLENLGLILYIEELISALSDEIIVSFHVNPGYQKEDIFTEVQLFRIIQEFATNVIKHSGATEMNIWLRKNSESIALVLSDNGHSFDYALAKKGMGLKNIQSRIESINGKHKWKNIIGTGSRLIIKIPRK